MTEQTKRLAVWRQVYMKYGIELEAQTIMEAIDELNGDPSMIRNGQLPKGKASDLDDATISEISEKIERTTVRLKVKELHEEREKILEEMIIFQKRLTKKFFDEEIDKLLSTTREPEKRVIKELRKAEEFAI